MSLLFFSFLAPFPFVLHVTVPRCLFVAVLVHAFVGAVCSCSSSQPMGQQVLYFIPLQSDEDKDHRLMLHLNVSICAATATAGLFQHHNVTLFPRTLLCGTASVTSSTLSFLPPSHAQCELLMPLKPPVPLQLGEETVCAPSACQIPRRTTLVHWR